MRNDFIKVILDIINNCAPNLFTFKIKNHKNVLDDIVSKTSFLDTIENVTELYRCIYYINNINEIPKCKICGNLCNKKISKYYNIIDLIKNPERLFYCSEKCYRNNETSIIKRKNTCLERYGVSCNLQLESTKKKIIEKYGVDNISKNKDIQLKKQETCLKKYGVDNPFKSNIIKQKIRDTNVSKYGVEYVCQNEDIKNKIIHTCIERYGVEHPCQNENIKNKYLIDVRTKNYYKLYTQDNTQSDVYILDDLDVYLKNKNNYNYLYNWKCKKCGLEFQSKIDPNLFPNYARCKNCQPKIMGFSNMEKEIVQFIKETDSNINVIEDSFDIISPHQLDIYIPEKKIAIEFDGLYWHSEQNIKDKKYHLKKTEMCLEKGIQLIHVFEDEWLNKKEIVKSRIRNFIGSYDKKIYARKCDIATIDTKTCREFENQNHLQGYVNSKINLGLYYDDELVSLMTFGCYRKSMGRVATENEYELLRFCSKLNYKVDGAAGKLFNRFVKKYCPNKIITYADRRWSKGDLYEKLGFTFIRNTDINYWYIINNKREYRFKYRKQELHKLLKKFDPTKTEYENMLDNGIDRIFDCGNIYFEKYF